ncbi:TetR/AcrR family transcriptional regulator [Sebaldella sp. S0638]|uniref:TetR/AcrR family transcriptional regulator n=1 Tax=Sebaldella sp. S0638 TaxID=2957809 RepID=UPI00209D2C25|nr:TetR/AcrR family transcriptional regulator [Sebaldella sp. S0638]MCP1224932.1 TetR/AcrR family transcriptional regulator [Sebaldella sp. S0638]
MRSKEMQKFHSKSLIVQSLLYLMRKKSFHEIKITEICNKAGVSRLSYYRNFESKEDIVLYYFNDNFEKIMERIIKMENISYKQLIEILFSHFMIHLEDNKLFFRDKLIYLISISSDEYLKKFMKVVFKDNSHDDFILKFLQGGIMNIMIGLMTGEESHSVEDIAVRVDFIYKMLSEGKPVL